MNNNQVRVLAEVLSLDAWHKPLRRRDGSTAHVELSFREGRLGSDNADFPFTFRVRLKRAQLTVRVEEPLKIKRDTIARGVPSNEAEMSQVLAVREAAKANYGLKGKISPTTMHVAASGSAQAEEDVSKAEEMRVVQRIPRILAMPVPGGISEYSWELVPGWQEALEGQPWDPVESPRFAMQPLVSTSLVDPSIKITVSCLLEDLEIDDLTPKDRGVIARVREAMFNDINTAAAIQQIKHALKEAQLEFGTLNDRFSRLLIADAISVEE